MAGIGTGFLTESILCNLIQEIYTWSTSGNIQLIGTPVYRYARKGYYVVFGIAFLILSMEILNLAPKQILKNGLITLLIFGISLVAISAIDANLKVMECTACPDGIKKLRWNEISYGLIITISTIIAILPNLYRMLKPRKNSNLKESK